MQPLGDIRIVWSGTRRELAEIGNNMHKRRNPCDLNRRRQFEGTPLRFTRIAVATLIGLIVSVPAAKADPIPVEPGSLVLPFSVHIARTSGDFESLFGLRVHRGDTLSGRVVIDGPATNDLIPEEPSHGFYRFTTARFEFAVPSGLTLQSSPFEPLTGVVTDGHFSSQFGRAVDTLVAESFVGGVSAQAIWIDVTARALVGDAFPTNSDILSGFGVVQLNLATPFGSLNGSSDPAPVPEPSTMVLTLIGAAMAGRAARRSRGPATPSA
ncbi:MAG TPA: PEP-CTERM sorting domain-containing protein [Longimicrobiales bacterium]|nr:PEP-CTERM sorting domain-containing protein [Longimicrobiales bacterium]